MPRQLFLGLLLSLCLLPIAPAMATNASVGASTVVDHRSSFMLTPLVTFDPNPSTNRPPELPEGLTSDSSGNLYVGLALTRQVRKITTDGHIVPFAEIPGRDEGGYLTGLVYNSSDSAIYAAIAAHGTSSHGIWRINQHGAVQQVYRLASARLPNGLAIRGQHLYVSDSEEGAIWRVPLRTVSPNTKQMGTPSGSATEEKLWFRHPLLKGDPSGRNIGANGIAFADARTIDGISGLATWLYVANTDFGRIVRIRVPQDPETDPLHIETLIENPALLTGADGITFGENGQLYVAVNRQHRLIRIDAVPDLSTVLLAEEGPLQFPASPVVRGDMLYVTNFALDTHGDPPRPAVLQMRLRGDGYAELGDISTSSGQPPRPAERVKRAGN